MKFILVAACILGMAVCAPPQMYMEFDIHYAPAEAIQAIPAGAAPDSLDVLLPVDAQGRPLAGPGYIKQEILQANGRTKDVYFPFGFNTRTAPAAPVDPAAPAAAPVDPVAPAAPVDPVAPAAPVDPVAPVVPVVPVAPVAPAAPAAPVAPIVPVIAASAPAAAPLGDDDDDDD